MRQHWPLVVLLAACSDPTGPADPDALPDQCASAFACRSPGIDIQVTSLTVGAARHDDVTGMAIIHPDSIPITFVLRNVGSDTAGASDVFLSLHRVHTVYAQTSLPHPAIAPGEEFRYSGMVSFQPYTTALLHDDRVHLQLSAYAEHDAAFHDNNAISPNFHLSAPLLRYTYSLSRDNITVGDTVTLNVVARNYGRHAAAPARTLTACLYARFTGCTPQYRTTTGNFMAPAVPAGGVVQFQAVVSIPATAAWQDATVDYTMSLCAATSDVPTYLDGMESCYVGARSLRVRPDYESTCAPPHLQPNASLTLAGYNCGWLPAAAGQEPATRRSGFHIVSFDAAANVTYHVQRSDTSVSLRLYNSDGMAVFDRDTAADRFRVASAQRLYLVHYSASDSFTITVTPEAAASEGA